LDASSPQLYTSQAARTRTRRPSRDERRRRQRRRRRVAVGALLVAIAAIVLVVWRPFGSSESERTGSDFARAWERGDYRAMYDELTPGARGEISFAAFKRAYEEAGDTATATKVKTGQPKEDGDAVTLPVTASTRMFGPVRGDVVLPISEGKVAWTPNLTFPGVPVGTQLSRESEAPRRAAILTRDGETIVSGPADARAPEGPAATIAGEMGAPESAKEKDALYARGFERDARVGATGLERALDEQLAGKPGGRLSAGERTLATAEPRPARGVRSTIDSTVQQASVEALGARFGGVAAIDPLTAEVRGLAGVAFSAPQPPGSTFKIITTAAALETDKVKMTDDFPVQTAANIDGSTLSNAHDESCGGSFEQSFAHSCNSVFAPLGVKVGAEDLVEYSERFGFNRQPKIQGAEPSTIPQPDGITSNLELGATAIGQGKVLATPLVLASAAQVVASRGVLREPTLVPGSEPREPKRIISRDTARKLEKLMIAVVEYGTGENAQLGGGIKVAGKTGTAELGVSGNAGDSAASNEDAWFTAYAPIKKPQLAVAVLVVRGGAGGDVAAPIAQQVLGASLNPD